MLPAIRAFRADDEPGLVALWTECGLVRPWNDPGTDIAIKRGERADELLVAEDGGAIVGSVMVGFDGHRGWVYYLAVAPDRQRTGLGRALMSAAEAMLRDRGCRKLNLMVRGSNGQARGFYDQLGYELSDVVVLAKWLDADAG